MQPLGSCPRFIELESAALPDPILTLPDVCGPPLQPSGKDGAAGAEGDRRAKFIACSVIYLWG